MIRLIQLFFGFFPLMFITTVKSEDVSLTQQTPEQANPGEEFVVEVNVQKGDVEGFAKFQLSLPAGYTAEQIDTKGATFTFDDQTVKVIWIALPAENEFTFTYKITVPESVSGNLSLGGKFSYLEDNNRMIAELKEKEIQIGTPEQLAEINKEPEPIPAEANVSREIAPQEDGSYLVTISINKKGISGFSKVEEFMPKTAEATEVESNNGVFTYLRGKAKIVWMSTPEDENFSVSYSIKPEGDFSSEQLTGEYAFLSDNETKKVSIQAVGMPIAAKTEGESNESTEETTMAESNQPQEIAEEKPQPTKQKEEISNKTNQEPEKMAADETEEKKEAKKEQVASNETQGNEQIPSPEEGIQYKVQILAGKKVVDEAYFKKMHNYEEGFVIENHQGWVKYTTGSYNVYKGARDKRENLNGSYELPGPFVTAYNNGQRITVQEALMITNQKWLK